MTSDIATGLLKKVLSLRTYLQITRDDPSKDVEDKRRDNDDKAFQNEKTCGIDMLEPYCSSFCPEDCMSGQWENVYWKQKDYPHHHFDRILTTNNVLTIECGGNFDQDWSQSPFIC